MISIFKTRLVLKSINAVIIIVYFFAPEISEAANNNSRYGYYGHVQLSYQRDWTDNGISTNRYTHDYNLGINGFVLDPRLFTFNTSGTFTQQIYDPGETIDFQGFILNASLLNERPKNTFLYWIPQPIRLRYSNFSSDQYDNTNYGMSLSYRIPKTLGFFHKGKFISFVDSDNGNHDFYKNGSKSDDNGYLIPFPALHFDYDVYEYKADDLETDVETYNIRAQTSKKHSRYSAAYERSEYGSSTSDTTTFDSVDLRADYNYNFDGQRIIINSNNRFYQAQYDKTEQITFTDFTSMVMRTGPESKNSMAFRIGGTYSEPDGSTNYHITAGTSYNKYLSPSASNIVMLDVTYGKSGSTTRHAEVLQDDLSLRVSRRLGLHFKATAGLNEYGELYSFSGSGTLSGKITTIASYGFTHAPYSEEGTSNTHLYRLAFNGRLFRNVTFSNNNTYNIRTVTDPVESFKENTLQSSANLLWNISRYIITVGASYVGASKEDGIDSDTWTESLYTGLTIFLKRGMQFYTNSAYSRNDTGVTTFSLKPKITWNVRKVILSSEYEYNWNESSTGETSVRHRFFAKMTRNFGGVLF